MPPRPKIATVTESDVALFLAKRKGVKKRFRKDKKVRSTDSADQISEFFLSNFSASNLLSVLKIKRGRVEEPITLEWIVREMLKLLDDPLGKVSEKMMILDRLRELLLLGCLQNRDLIDEVIKKTTPGSKSEEEIPDPFLKLRKREA